MKSLGARGESPPSPRARDDSSDQGGKPQANREFVEDFPTQSRRIRSDRRQAEFHHGLLGTTRLAVASAALALVGSIAILLGCSGDAPSDPAAARNVVVFCIDTLRADHLGSYGYGRETSPVIDELARRGTLFEDAIAHSSWTVPATASLLTSLYPSEHGAVVAGEVKHLDEGSLRQLRREVRSLGQILEEAGFRTALLSANPYLFGRFKRGFELAEVGRQSATSLSDRALSWLEEIPEEERFFLYMQYMDLHTPVEPPEPYFRLFPVADGGTRGDEHRNWRFGQVRNFDNPEFLQYRAHRIAAYDGALRYVDAEIGRVMDALAAAGRLDDTVIVVTSDHGEEFWDHAEIEYRLGGDPRGLWGIGHGHSMFQELIRVPLIFVGPEIRAGARIGCGAPHLDVAPTLLAMLGLPAEAPMRGRSLRSWLEDGPAPGDCKPVPLVADSPAYGVDTQAIVYGGWKLIRRPEVTLLYDLRSDPEERHDLAAERPELVAEMDGLLRAVLAGAPEGNGGEPMEIDAETERQLRALGYL